MGRDVEYIEKGRMVVERKNSLGYIEVQDVQALRRAAKKAGLRVRWEADGKVKVTNPNTKQVVRAGFNQHVYEIIEAIEKGNLW